MDGVPGPQDAFLGRLRVLDRPQEQRDVLSRNHRMVDPATTRLVSDDGEGWRLYVGRRAGDPTQVCTIECDGEGIGSSRSVSCAPFSQLQVGPMLGHHSLAASGPHRVYGLISDEVGSVVLDGHVVEVREGAIDVVVDRLSTDVRVSHAGREHTFPMFSPPQDEGSVAPDQTGGSVVLVQRTPGQGPGPQESA